MHDVLQEQGITARAESLSVPALQDTMEVNAVIEHLRQKYPLPPAAIVIIGDPAGLSVVLYLTTCGKMFR